MTDPAKTEEQRTFFANRLKKRFKHLWKYAKRVETNAFRVYHRDIPEIPFAVDWYDGHLHIAEYARPHERTDEEHDAWLETMVDTAARTLTVPRGRVFFKRRERQRGSSQYEPLERRNYTITVEEHGLLFQVNLSDYIDTGLFLDHRELRLYVAKGVTQHRVLNLFAYTGSFTVYAAAAGASSTVTVDLSNTYLTWARKNMQLNALDAPNHEFRRGDVLEEIETLRREGRKFDTIVLDPPSFSNSKNMRDTFDVQRDHVGLINACIELLDPAARGGQPGRVIFSTNKRRFQFHRQELNAGETRKLTKLTMPDDFAGTNIHQVWSIVAPTRRSRG
ncbi:MAG: class I SAM-dependent methyltransferase [Spirochaeta sp.]|jgi:23S rRNA (cytosine1962-C5)-methyltransferase|nr:class I SAM-dependent methyltransferase [Spirochaeta sp.]